MEFGGRETCPRCLSEISAERANSIPKVCEGCGHVLSSSEQKWRQQLERGSLKWVVGVAVALVLSYMQVSSWGSYSLEIIPYQLSDLAGIESKAGLERLAQICMDTKKYDCVEENYARLARTDGIEAVARLGRFQFNRMKYNQAAATLQNYFTNGGQDLDVRYVWARALSESGQVDEASKQFDVILDAKPDVLQVTVAQNYIKLLVQHGRLDRALRVIDGIRKRGDSVAQFMDYEYKDISQKLGKKSS